MNQNTIDLKQMLFLIREQKDVEANFILDEGCTIESENPKPLIKVLNYLFNFMSQFTDRPMEISLDLLSDSYRLTFLSFCDLQEEPAISDQLSDALNDYDAEFSMTNHAGQYLQLVISFKRS